MNVPLSSSQSSCLRTRDLPHDTDLTSVGTPCARDPTKKPRRQPEVSIAALSGFVAGTMARVSVACDARAVAPVLEALARGERVPVNVEPWQVIAGDVPATIPEATA